MMPFGLISAPSTFQRLMDGLLNGLHDFTVAYLDDIIIYSDTRGNHLNHMEIVLDKLREARLKVKERKCAFGSGSCIYLGHVVGNGLVQPMECKVEAVKTFKQPKTKKDVRSFLGLCGYYRKSIPNFSSIATPLSDLTRKSIPKLFKWNGKCDKVFIEQKEVLTRAPILVTPDWTKPFILQTDASAFGLGYVLSQIDGTEKEHLISFASKNY